MRKLGLSLVMYVVVVATTAAAEVRLLMFDQPGCIYCLRWTNEVGDAYANTDEGRAAPLWRLNIRDELPATITLQSKPVFTPTFVLLDSDHREVARIEGYPGEDFFWGLLNSMLAQLPNAQGETYE